MSDRPLTSEQTKNLRWLASGHIYDIEDARREMLRAADSIDSLTAENERLRERITAVSEERDRLSAGWRTSDADLAALRERLWELEESSIDRYVSVMKDAGLDAMSHEDGWTLMRKEAAEQLSTELEAVRLVCIEARELIGEADATGEIPQANINALRALLWRASIKARAALTKGATDAQADQS